VTPSVEKLLVIQEHDCRIMKFERELADVPGRKASIDSLLDEHRQALAKAKDEHKAMQAGIKKAELEVESSRDRIRKLREQQMQLKSNKDFRTMEEEILAAEKGIRKIEDQMLEMMEGVEAAHAVVRQREKDLKTEEDSVKREVAAIEQRGLELREEMARVQQNRATLAAEIDPTRLQEYERIMHNKKDRALVAVENGTCGGCHMKLPPYLCHEAKKQTDVVLCEFCRRMLY
jgi:uncharacterized protein